MAYCLKCGNQVHDNAEVCGHCGNRMKGAYVRKDDEYVYMPGNEVDYPYANQHNNGSIKNDGNNVARFLLILFLGVIGGFIINHSSLKPYGWRFRTCAYFFLNLITFGIYPLVAMICNLTFNPNNSSNIGYFRD